MSTIKESEAEVERQELKLELSASKTEVERLKNLLSRTIELNYLND
jgi:hypothetical protein